MKSSKQCSNPTLNPYLSLLLYANARAKGNANPNPPTPFLTWLPPQSTTRTSPGLLSINDCHRVHVLPDNGNHGCMHIEKGAP